MEGSLLSASPVLGLCRGEWCLFTLSVLRKGVSAELVWRTVNGSELRKLIKLG